MFLGFTFRPRRARRGDGVQFTSFLPAISKEALKKISTEVWSWRLHRHMEMTSAEIARWINPRVRGLDDLLRDDGRSGSRLSL
jgi:RNA-directed DNA polymerase